MKPHQQPPVPELHWNPEPAPAGVAGDTYRGQWPGGWAEDPETRHLAWTSAGEPVWACPMCQHGSLHTLAEHQQLVGPAAKEVADA
jgi:hypothetical protein